MKGPTVLTDKTDIKIYILTLMSELFDPLELHVISDLVCGRGNVGSFDFSECFAELEELGHVQGYDETGVRLYAITESGVMVASELADGLPDELRRLASLDAARLLSMRRKERRLRCTITEKSPLRYMVRCEIEDKKQPMLRVEIMVASMFQAERIRTHFTEKPEEVMRALLTVMTGDIDYFLN